MGWGGWVFESMENSILFFNPSWRGNCQDFKKSQILFWKNLSIRLSLIILAKVTLVSDDPFLTDSQTVLIFFLRFVKMNPGFLLVEKWWDQPIRKKYSLFYNRFQKLAKHNSSLIPEEWSALSWFLIGWKTSKSWKSTNEKQGSS